MNYSIKQGQQVKRKNPSKYYWIWGKHSVMAALSNPNRKIVSLLVSSKEQQEQIKELEGIDNALVQIKSNQEIQQIVGEECNDINFQGIALKTAPLVQPQLNELIANAQSANFTTLVILDQVTDPRNIGAIIRSCSAFRVDAIVVPNHSSAQESSYLVKTSAGAFEIMPMISVNNIANTIKYLKREGYWIIGMDNNATESISAATIDFNKVAILMGGEEKGLRRLSKLGCDLLLKIPMSNKVNSLNVSSAASIVLHIRYTSCIPQNSALPNRKN